MKKVLLKFLCAGLALIVFSVQTMAYSTIASAYSEEEITAVANFDEVEIYSAFSDVDQLVALVQENEGITYTELKANHSDLVANISSSSALTIAGSSDTPPIFSAFIWGCLLNWVGMLIVGLTTGFDGDQITKSLWGCLINSLLIGGGWGCSSYYSWGYY
jgi:hypothetical protein